MNIDIPKAVLEITSSEAITLHYSLRIAIEHTIDTHWVMHPGCYPTEEHERLHMMRLLARCFCSDHSDIEQSLQKRLTDAVAARSALLKATQP